VVERFRRSADAGGKAWVPPFDDKPNPRRGDLKGKAGGFSFLPSSTSIILNIRRRPRFSKGRADRLAEKAGWVSISKGGSARRTCRRNLL